MKVCRMGLDSIWIDHANGDVRMCSWTGYYIGNLIDNTIEELWHSEKAEKFRQSMLDGSYCYCDRKECPYFANNNIDSILVDYNVPEYPRYCSLSYEQQCNYVCKFCRKEKYIPKPGEKEGFKKIESEINKFIDGLDNLASNGIGELFCSDSTLKFLGKAKLKDSVTIGLESNGSLFNERNWEKISNLGKYNLEVAITVHSFQEDTYQFLSGTKASVENVIQNLHFIKKLREEGIINNFEIATVVCERNFREMPEFVTRCLEEFNPDTVRLRFFKPYGVNSLAIEWFYDIRNPYHPYYQEFLQVMKNPVFQNEKVWKWQGDTLSDQKQHPYFKEHTNYMLLYRLASMDNIKEKLKNYLYEHDIKKFALYGNSYVGQAFASMLNNMDISFGEIFDTNASDTVYKEHRVIKPETDNLVQYDMIIVTSVMYFDDIKNTLRELKYNGNIVNLERLIEEFEMCQI